MGLVVSNRSEFVLAHTELEQAFVDGRSGPGGALVIHRRDDLPITCFRVIFEDDDLGVLAAQLDETARIRVEFFDGKGDGVDFLDESRADVFSDG